MTMSPQQRKTLHEHGLGLQQLAKEVKNPVERMWVAELGERAILMSGVEDAPRSTAYIRDERGPGGRGGRR